MLNHGKYSDLTSEQYEYLGRAFIEWSNLEFLLGLLLSRLLFTPEFLGRTYSDEMSAVKLEIAVKNALDIHRTRYNHLIISKELDLEIVELMVDVANLRVMRNKFAHLLWVRKNDKTMIGFKMSGKQPTKTKPKNSVSLSVDDLIDNYKKSHDLVEKIGDIIVAIPEVKEEQYLRSK
ncbi:MAG: hypothetical protein COA83_00310 [Methylophaga sp.]|nr:MAG: hypothetical protein COA83_00310 [Methylophaga sp.]